MKKSFVPPLERPAPFGIFMDLRLVEDIELALAPVFRDDRTFGERLIGANRRLFWSVCWQGEQTTRPYVQFDGLPGKVREARDFMAQRYDVAKIDKYPSGVCPGRTCWHVWITGKKPTA